MHAAAWATDHALRQMCAMPADLTVEVSFKRPMVLPAEIKCWRLSDPKPSKSSEGCLFPHDAKVLEFRLADAQDESRVYTEVSPYCRLLGKITNK
eukprot:1421360-Pyramimonas_sp.AAC.1